MTFQSTLSVWRVTETDATPAGWIVISIHTLCMESDSKF